MAGRAISRTAGNGKDRTAVRGPELDTTVPRETQTFNLGGKSKMKKSPWHSIKQPVHHDNTECNTGNNIETENLRQGTGGKPLCTECSRLARENR